MQNENTPNATDAFTSALLSGQPSAGPRTAAHTYDRFMGSWEATVTDYAEDGTARTSTGEWHFSWILEGRAVQDVFIVPARSLRTGDISPAGNRYGTTIRVFDETTQRWKIYWFNAANGSRNILEARDLGDHILQEEKRDNGQINRWTFTDMQQDSFNWLGETSADGGNTWRRQSEFHVVRREIL
jgi:hypothetical protein